MGKRVAVVLSGAQDGVEIREAVLLLLSLERGGAEPVCVAPAGALADAGRLTRDPVRDIAGVSADEISALVVPGGGGVATVLSNYADKGDLCDVQPDLAKLLKACLSARRPMGFMSMSPLLAARVLGPVAGVRITLGPRGTVAAKHAAVMGADVRPCPPREIVIDAKSGVVTTPAHMYDDARLPDVAVSVDKVVRMLLALANQRTQRGERPQRFQPPGGPRPAVPGPRPGLVEPRADSVQIRPGRGSGGSGRAPSDTRPPRSPSPPRGS